MNIKHAGIKSERFPDVSISVEPDHASNRLRVNACSRVFAIHLIDEDDPMVIANAADSAAEAAIRHGAMLALPLVGVDWNGIFQLGMSVVGKDGVRGTATFVDKKAELVRFEWEDGSDTGMFEFDHVLDFLASGAWKP